MGVGLISEHALWRSSFVVGVGGTYVRRCAINSADKFLHQIKSEGGLGNLELE